MRGTQKPLDKYLLADRLEYGWMGEWVDGWRMDGGRRISGWKDGWMNGG